MTNKSIFHGNFQTFIFNKFKVKRKQKRNYRGKFLSARKRLYLELGKVDHKSQIKYSNLLPLNQLWLSYMRKVLGVESFTSIPENSNNPNWENVNQQLIKADFHGAKISIEKSKCPTLVGLTGIVIQDTKNTFRICGLDNVVRSKQYAEFADICDFSKVGTFYIMPIIIYNLNFFFLYYCMYISATNFL